MALVSYHRKVIWVTGSPTRDKSIITSTFQNENPKILRSFGTKQGVESPTQPDSSPPVKVNIGHFAVCSTSSGTRVTLSFVRRITHCCSARNSQNRQVFCNGEETLSKKKPDRPLHTRGAMVPQQQRKSLTQFSRPPSVRIRHPQTIRLQR